MVQIKRLFNSAICLQTTEDGVQLTAISWILIFGWCSVYTGVFFWQMGRLLGILVGQWTHCQLEIIHNVQNKENVTLVCADKGNAHSLHITTYIWWRLTALAMHWNPVLLHINVSIFIFVGQGICMKTIYFLSCTSIRNNMFSVLDLNSMAFQWTISVPSR